MAHVRHLCGHLAGVSRVDAVVAGGGREQRAGVLDVGLHVLVGRVLADVGPVVGIVRVAVLGHPACAGQQLVVAPHVQQGHLGHHRIEEVRALGHCGAHQKAAVGAALYAQVRGRREAVVHQPLRHRQEVVVGALPVFFEGRAPPRRPELAAATNVGEHVHAAPLHPSLARQCVVARRARDLEAAVRRQKRRVAAVVRDAFLVHDKEGDLRAVGRRNVVLFHLQPLGVEHVGQLPDEPHRAVLVGHVQGRRLGESAVGEEEAIEALVGGHDAHGSHRRRGKLLARPLAVPPRVAPKLALHVVQHADQQVVLGRRRPLDDSFAAGLGDDPEVAVAGQKVVHVRGYDRRRGKRPAAHRPLRNGAHDQVVARDEGGGVGRRVDLHKLAVHDQVGRALEDRVQVRDPAIRLSADLPRADEDRHVGLVGVEDHWRVGERRAALPEARLAGIARSRQRAGAEVGGHNHRFVVHERRAALGLRKEEPVFHESERLQVELPRLHRVGATPGECDETPAMLGRQAGHAPVSPGDVFLFGERVNVQNGLPRRLPRQVGIPRRPPVDAPGMVVV